MRARTLAVEEVDRMTTGGAVHQGRTVARQWRDARRQSRRLRGIVEGARYRLARRGPDPLAGDDIVAERVRASLGLVSKRLDVPRAHVMVTGHVATLHGEVGTIAEALSLARAAGAVPGVMAVRCRLHVGLLPGQGRPSHGRMRRRAPSEPLHVLLDAAAQAGAGAEQAPTAVRAVVEAFAACLPARERGRLSAALPADLRRLALPRHRCRWTDQPADLLNCVTEVSGLGDLVRAERLTVAVLGGLSEILPPADAARIEPALAPPLRPLWRLARRQGQPQPPGARRRVWREVSRGEWQWTLTPNGSNPTPARLDAEGG
jgi:uncharacterized protein (DUF2267 family)